MHQTYCMNNSFHTLLDKVVLLRTTYTVHTGFHYDDLNCYQWGGDTLLDKRAGEVLVWGLRLLEQGTSKRGDYSNFSSSLWFGLAGKNVWRTSDLPSLAPITLQGFNQYQCYN